MKRLSPRVGILLICIVMLADIGLLAVEFMQNGQVQSSSITRALIIFVGLVLTLIRLLMAAKAQKIPVEMYEAQYRDQIRTAFNEKGREKQKKQLLTGIGHYCRNEYNAAVKKLAALLKECQKTDDHVAVLLFLGLCYSDVGSTEYAIDIYYALLKQDDTRSTAWSNLGLLLKKQGKHEDAINCYLNAVKHDPNNAYAWNNLANAYITVGEWENVIEPAKKSLSIKGDMYQADNALTMAYHALGDKENCRKHYDLAILHGSDKESLDNALKALSGTSYEFVGTEEADISPIERAHQRFRGMTAEPLVKIGLPFPDSGNKSRIGGAPVDTPDRVPKDRQGRPMGLLAAIWCSEVTGLPNFPKEGVLRFYITDDGTYGANLNDPTDTSGFAVLYDADEGLFEQGPQVAPDGTMSEHFPVKGCYTLKFFPEMGHMLSSDYRYEKAMEAALVKEGMAGGLAELTQAQRDQLKQSNHWGGHRLGGSPCFERKDPRGENPDLQKYDTLLLQIVTHQAVNKSGKVMSTDIEFGHEGGCQFFISAEKLRAKDFSDVLYWWDDIDA